MIVSARRRRPAALRSAFTLLEVLVVVAIIVILAGVAGVAVFGFLDDSKENVAKQQCAELEKAAKAFGLKPGQNGDLAPNLNVLVNPAGAGLNMTPVIEGGEGALVDPWQQPYQYEIQDFQGRMVPVVTSRGQPGKNKQLWSDNTYKMLYGQKQP